MEWDHYYEGIRQVNVLIDSIGSTYHFNLQKFDGEESTLYHQSDSFSKNTLHFELVNDMVVFL